MTTVNVPGGQTAGAADSDPNSMTTVFRWMIDWAADSDPRSMTTGFGWIIDSSGPANRIRCRLGLPGLVQVRWRMDWAADSARDPNSMTFQLGWMIDWAADSDPNSTTTGFGWTMDLGGSWADEPNSMTTGFRVGWRIAPPTRTRIRRLLFRLEPEFDDYCLSFPMDDRLGHSLQVAVRTRIRRHVTVTTGFRWIRLAGGLQRLSVGRRTEFDVDWISMEGRLGRRL